MPEYYKVGDCVELISGEKCQIKYVGETHFHINVCWYGVEFIDETKGNHNGTYDKVTYFKGKPLKCKFIRFEKIKKKLDAQNTIESKINNDIVNVTNSNDNNSNENKNTQNGYNYNNDGDNGNSNNNNKTDNINNDGNNAIVNKLTPPKRHSSQPILTSKEINTVSKKSNNNFNTMKNINNDKNTDNDNNNGNDNNKNNIDDTIKVNGNSPRFENKNENKNTVQNNQSNDNNSTIFKIKSSNVVPKENDNNATKKPTRRKSAGIITKPKYVFEGDIVIGHRYLLLDDRYGICRYYGKTQFGSGLWIGLDLEMGIGNHNGTINGVTYFECTQGKGAFVQRNKIAQDLGFPNGKLTTMK